MQTHQKAEKNHIMQMSLQQDLLLIISFVSFQITKAFVCLLKTILSYGNINLLDDIKNDRKKDNNIISGYRRRSAF